MSNNNFDGRSTTISRKKPKKKRHPVVNFFRKLMAVIATTLLSLFLVMVITGTIVATALTVYVLDFMEDSTSISMAELESGSDTYFYGTEFDENGEEQLKVLQRIKTDVHRIPVSIDQIPQHVRNAFVCTEDERFYIHDGVDYKRTFSAFLNMFIHFYDTDQGGSTITQQLIKNLTGDDERSPQRKIREIFSAMQLEKKYSKDKILEEYLNYIGFGGPRNGIQKASRDYFGKDVSELTVPEAAVLAAIPQSPEWYGPFVEYEDEDTGQVIIDGKANNKERQEYVLWQMYKNGTITYDEYQEYLNTHIVYTDSEEYKRLHPEIELEKQESENENYTWEVDAMMYEAAGYLMEQYDIDEQEAIKRINKGGYRIYSTIDRKMQDYVEEKFLDINNIVSASYVTSWADIDGDGQYEEYLPHIAFVALRYDGSVMCQVGDLGPKVGSLSTSYAVREPRQIGSTMKPISTYGYAIENNKAHWGSVFQDKPVTEVNGKPWPTNYTVDSSISLSYASNFLYYFLQQSFNTVPAQICDTYTPHEIFEFSKNKLGLQLDPSDEALSPLSVGALTYGITLENLVNAYLPYGNNGIYNDAHIISKIEDASHNVIYSNDGNPREAVSSETAWVMNRLLRNVVQNGTGTSARCNNKVVCGKTGTTDNWYDLTFVGLTRDFVSGITIGYKYYNESLSLPINLHSADIWKNIIGDYVETMFTDTPADFEPDPNVIEAPMCSATGMIAGPYCPKGITGFWKSTNAPYCGGNHGYVDNGQSGGGNTNTNTNTNTNSNANTGGGNASGQSAGGNAGGAVDYTGGGADYSGGGVDNSGGGYVDNSGGAAQGGGAVQGGGADVSGGGDNSGAIGNNGAVW